jgi:predicted metal-dependent hydrolase
MKFYIIICVIVLIFVILYTTSFKEEVTVVSENDKNTYVIRRGSKTREYLAESANILAEINKRVELLIKHLYQKYSNDHVRSYYIRELKKRYKPSILSEAAIDNKYTTYTVDKSEMHICLRTRDSYEKTYDIDLLMYVVLHELAHLCNFDRFGNPIIGHGKEFIEIFKLLVSEAMLIGVYTYTNYKTNPKEYCGIVLNSSIIG